MKRPAQLDHPKSPPKVSKPGQMRRMTILRAVNDNAPPLRRRLRAVAAAGAVALLFVLLVLAI